MGQLASGGRRSRPGPSRRDLVRSAPRHPVDRRPPSCCVPWAKTEENNLSHVASYQRFDSICEGPTLTPSHLPETPSPHLTTPAIRFQHMNLRQTQTQSTAESAVRARPARPRGGLGRRAAWSLSPPGREPWPLRLSVRPAMRSFVLGWKNCIYSLRKHEWLSRFLTNHSSAWCFSAFGGEWRTPPERSGAFPEPRRPPCRARLSVALCLSAMASCPLAPISKRPRLSRHLLISCFHEPGQTLTVKRTFYNLDRRCHFVEKLP